jgi:hypothetical protein
MCHLKLNNIDTRQENAAMTSYDQLWRAMTSEDELYVIPEVFNRESITNVSFKAKQHGYPTRKLGYDELWPAMTSEDEL